MTAAMGGHVFFFKRVSNRLIETSFSFVGEITLAKTSKFVQQLCSKKAINLPPKPLRTKRLKLPVC